MLQKEFEERIGRSVTQEEYVEANAMYMMAGDDIDKDVFCREWQKIGGTRLVQGLFETAHRLNQELQEQQLMTKECQEIQSDAADAMLEICDAILDGETVEHTTEELTKKAWWLVGQKEVTRRKVEKGYRLDDKDRETILAAMVSRHTEQENSNNQ